MVDDTATMLTMATTTMTMTMTMTTTRMRKMMDDGGCRRHREAGRTGTRRRTRSGARRRRWRLRRRESCGGTCGTSTWTTTRS
eukprot:1147288-Rhodomonas_salina.1